LLKPVPAVQDHNYGGATAGAGGAAAGNGSAASSTVRLTSSSQQPLRSTGIRTSRSSMSEENQEPFPIIGGLASYLGTASLCLQIFFVFLNTVELG
jgi:hypothetical protein